MPKSANEPRDRFTLDLPPDVGAWLRATAAREGRTLMGQVAVMIRREMEREALAAEGVRRAGQSRDG